MIEQLCILVVGVAAKSIHVIKFHKSIHHKKYMEKLVESNNSLVNSVPMSYFG